MKTLCCLIGSVLVLTAVPAAARDTKDLIPISVVISMPEVACELDQNLKLYFGNQQGPQGTSRGVTIANPKTSGVGTKDRQGYRRVMLSAPMELQKKARNVGGIAVMGIESSYKEQPFVSETEFECHAGGIIIGVALRRTIVKV